MRTLLPPAPSTTIDLKPPPPASARPATATVDRALAAAARAGDRDARATLLTTMLDPWYRFCAARLRGHRRAADATQETALRVLRGLSGFDGRSQFSTWTFGIALNVCRELRRSEDRHRAAELGEDAYPSDDGYPLPSAADAEEAARVRAAVAALPPRQREVVTLRFYEALGVRQSAAIMSCAEGTVKANLFAAMRSLRARLGTDHDAGAVAARRNQSAA